MTAPSGREPVFRRIVSGNWILNLPENLMHHPDETLGDEFEREFWEAMAKPLDDE